MAKTIDKIISKETFAEFEEYTNFALNDFLFLFSEFVNEHYDNIISYYRGDTNELNQDSVDRLNSLYTKNLDLQDKLNLFIEDYDTFEYWELLEYLEEIGSEIERTKVIYKYLRSAKYDGFNENSLIQSYTMTNGDTLERIADRDRDDSQNSWFDIAVKNNLLETDWVAGEGGKSLEVGKKVLNKLFLNSVVDRLQGETVYGLDIDMNFEFDTTEEDIKVLSYKDTFKQSVDILLSAKRGDVPEFPNLGLSSDRVVGGNLSDFAIPFIVRELEDAIATDDTIVNFKINSIRREGSTFKLECQLESFYNFIYNKNAQIQI